MSTATVARAPTGHHRPARPVGRFEWRPVEIAAVHGCSTHLADRRIVILGGDDADVAALAARLHTARSRVTAVPATAELDPAAAIRRLGGIDVIIDLNLGTTSINDAAEAWPRAFRRSLQLLRACLPDWTAEEDCQRIGYVPVIRTGGQLGAGPARVDHPYGGLWAGLAKGLPREIPNCNIRIVDLTDEPLHPSALADLVAAELYRWGLFEVGHRDGRRYTLQAVPAPPGPVARPVGPADTIVMTGGGRGIGFALALHCATRYGTRVIVTGRNPAPDPHDPVLALDEPAFARYRNDRLRAAAHDRSLPQARAELARTSAARDLLNNLRTAAAADAPVEYHQCDATDTASVAALVDRAGPGLVGVIHNAGVDTPARLATKTDEAAERVIRVKVDGLRNILAALHDRPAPAFLCTVGSLTGRWGGMVGQLDYGAANEALSYLTRWAASRFPATTSVRTLCWPTWEQLGLITNYAASLQYMSALDVQQGIELWHREIISTGSGEVSFIGDVGPAISPILIRGYSPRSALPAIQRLASAARYLGEPAAYRPGQLLTARTRLVPPGGTAHLDFRIDDEPATPISVVLEHLLAAGAWLTTDPSTPHTLNLQHVWIGLDALRRTARPGATVTTRVRRQPGAGHRLVIRIADRAGLVARGTVALTTPAQQPTARPTHPSGSQQAAVGNLGWLGHSLRIATPPTIGDRGELTLHVEPDRLADLFDPQAVLQPRLGFAIVENLVRTSWALQHTGRPRAFTLTQLTSLGGPPAAPAVIRVNTTGTWTATIADTVHLTAHGVQFITDPSHPPRHDT